MSTDYVTVRVELTPPVRKMLQIGYAIKSATPSKPSVNRLAERAGVPASIVGSVCNVRGYDRDTDWLELGQFHRLIGVLYDI